MELGIIYAAVFVAGLVLFDLVIRFAEGQMRRTKVMNYRLKLLEGAENNIDVYKSMVRERGLDFDSAGQQLLVWARRMFAQSGLRIKFGRALLYGLAIILVGWIALGYFFDIPTLWRVAIVALLVIAVPVIVVAQARSARITKFNGQLSDALDVVARSLSAGHPLPTAIAMVSRELPDPVGTEFGMLSDELTYGTELDQAMQNMITRVGSEDLKLIAVSMSVQRGTGGNFVEVLENLSAVIRDRGIVRAKIKSLSAEGRITAIFMTLYPFLLYLMITFMKPDYFNPIWASGNAGIIIVALLTLMAVGDYIIYRLVNFDF
jgi:tight adherence protein B